MNFKLMFHIVATMIAALVFVSSTHSQWILQASGTIVRLSDVAFIDSTSAVAVGANGTILKTTDNGLHWNLKSSGTTNTLNAVALLQGYGYAVGTSVICRTTDSGELWSAVADSENFTTADYQFGWSGAVYFGTESGKLRYDVGLGWRERRLVGGAVTAIAVGRGSYNDHDVTASTNELSYYADGASPWDSTSIPLASWDRVFGGDLHQGHAQYLVGVAGQPNNVSVIFRRPSSFAQWERIANTNIELGTFLADACAIPDSNDVYVCGSDGKIFLSTNKGNSWTRQPTNTSSWLNAMVLVEINGRGKGFAVGDSGTILFTDNGGITSVNALATQPIQFGLEQNFPNPFNPTTTIRFSIPQTGSATLKIFNVLGEEVATLVDENLSVSSYQKTFDASGLTSGVYFYQLKAGSFVEAKKLVLLR